MRVPTYEGRVATRPIHQQGVEGRAIEGVFGGGQGLAALAQGVGRMGNALAEVRDLEDMTRAKDAENEFALYMQGAMYGENGYMLSEGRNAFEGRAAFMSQAEKKRREIAGRLKGGAQRTFNEASTMRMLDVNGRVLVHAGNGQKAWVKEASSARANLFAQDALNSVGNESQINRHIASGLLEIREQAKLEGMSGEALAVKERAYVSGVQANLVLQLAQSDPLEAEAYLKQVEGQLDPKTRFDLEAKLEEPVLWAKAAREMQIGKMKEVGDFRFAPAVEKAIVNAAAQYGVPEQALAVIAMIESKGNPAAKNPKSSAGGLFQQIDSNAKQYGVKNRYDAAQSADGAAAFMRDNMIYLRRRLGREPTVGELYLAHQQGAAGAAALLANPHAKAVDIVGEEAVRLNGGDENMTAGQFARIWTAKAERVAGGGVAMEEYIARIDDPKLRAATQHLWEKEIAAQKAGEKQARDEAIGWIDKQLIGYPQMDLNSLPLDVQHRLGASGMQTLRNYQKSALEEGGVKTNDAVYVELVRMSIDDPASFAQINPLELRDQLSDSDWKQVMGWWRAAKDKGAGGGSGAGGDKIGFSMAQGMARAQLDGVGINAKEGKQKEEAQFYRALSAELVNFIKENGRAVNEGQAMEIINRLLLPMAMEEDGWLWGTNKRDIYAFEASERDIESQVKPRDAASYDQIPIEEALEIYNDLGLELGRKPTKEEVARRWVEWKTGIEAGEEGTRLIDIIGSGASLIRG